MVGWHHQHNGHVFGWTLGFGDGQGGLACCGSWGCKDLDATELNESFEITFYGITQRMSFTLKTFK